MRGKANSRHRQIDSAAKAVFLAGLRDGLCREDSAAAAGFSLTGFYGARRRDCAFAAEWKEALALPPAADRRVQAYVQRGEIRIAPANRRLLQRRRRKVRFCRERRELYVTCLAETCDSLAAARVAGIPPSTARLHRRADPAFDSACIQALQSGYVFLETEAVRLRLDAQRRLRAAIDRADPVPSPALLADEGAEFDRIMKLLARQERRQRGPDRRFREDGHRQAWTFEDAVKALDKALDGLGTRRAPLPPIEGEGEG